MNYGPRYSAIIRGTKRIPRNLIKTNTIYRLISYEYANGITESLSGQRATLIFVFGIYKREIHALKLNVVNPDIFFRWLRRARNRSIKESAIKNSELSELIQQTEETGKAFFTSRIKGNSIYKIEPRAYRTYKFFNVKDIEEVYFKENDLIKIFGKPNVSQKDELVDKREEKLIREKNIKEVENTMKKIQPEVPSMDELTPSMDDFIDATMDILNKE